MQLVILLHCQSIYYITNPSIMLPIHLLCYQLQLHYQFIYYVTNPFITLPIHLLRYQSINYITNQSIVLPINYTNQSVMLLIGWLCNHQRVRQLLFVTYWLARNNFFLFLLPCYSNLKPVDYIIFKLCIS